MLALLTALFNAVGAFFGYMTKSIVGLGTRIYNNHFDPAVKRKKKAAEKGKNAVDKGDKYGLLDALQDSKRD